MPESQKSAGRTPNLYPPREPFAQRMMDVPGGHRIYVEQCGHAEGVPVIVLHGGPGGGCSPGMRRYFDPKHFRTVLFDQRGCGRSTPTAEVENNTTWDLVADIELIREELGIDKWIVFGGSWGATLALIYAQTHPDRVSHLVLRGVFLMTQRELDWFYGGGAGNFWPREWDQFRNMVPEDEQSDLIAAYHSRLFCDDLETQTRFARSWTTWENALASISPSGRGVTGGAYARSFARLENHYFTHHGFLEEDGQILRDMDSIAHIPGVIVQGRYDMICPPVMAQKLKASWPGARLAMVPDAGHALSEPGISAELVDAMNTIRNQG